MEIHSYDGDVESGRFIDDESDTLSVSDRSLVRTRDGHCISVFSPEPTTYE